MDPKELEPPVPEEEIAAAAEQPAEETPVEAEEKPAVEKEPEREKFVPHQALHEEREKRKQAQREFEEYKRKDAQEKAFLQDRLNQLFQAAQPQAPQFRDPDKDPDPLDALKHNQALLAHNAQQQAAWRQQQENQARQVQYQRNLTSWASAKAQEFAQQTPDFGDAYQHIRTVRAQELMAMGLTGEELVNRLHGEELSVFHEAHQKGLNPAEIAYNMAKAAGWAPKKQEQSAEQKIETLQKGTQASKTLGSGGAASGMPTPEQIAAMNDEDFEALKQKLKGQGKRISDII